MMFRTGYNEAECRFGRISSGQKETAVPAGAAVYGVGIKDGLLLFLLAKLFRRPIPLAGQIAKASL
jgi:hypothetical protein